jgi:hypothetical protein
MAHPFNHPHPPYPTQATLDGIRRPTAPGDTNQREAHPTTERPNHAADRAPACHMKGRWF